MQVAQKRLDLVIGSLTMVIDQQAATERLQREYLVSIAPYNRSKAKTLLLKIKHEQKTHAHCQEKLVGLHLLLSELKQMELNQLVYSTYASANKVMKHMQANPILVEKIMDETQDILAINTEIQNTLCALAPDTTAWDDTLELELANLCDEAIEEECVDLTLTKLPSVPRRNVFCVERISAQPL